MGFDLKEVFRVDVWGSGAKAIPHFPLKSQNAPLEDKWRIFYIYQSLLFSIRPSKEIKQKSWSKAAETYHHSGLLTIPYCMNFEFYFIHLHHAKD